MAKRKKKNIVDASVQISPKQNTVTVVYGMGTDMYGMPYVYFEYDKEHFDALESLEHEIIDNVIHPINIFPDTTFSFTRHNHTFWSVEGHIPKDKSIGVDNDIDVYAYYWIMVHWYDKNIDLPVHMSIDTIEPDCYNDKTKQRLEEILNNNEFDYRLLSGSDEKGAYLVSFCDRWENVENLKNFMSEYLGYTEDEIKKAIPEYFEHIEIEKQEKETQQE